MSTASDDSLAVDDAQQSASLIAWLSAAVRDGASDLHLVAGHPPVQRLHGELRATDDAILTDDTLRPLLQDACPDQVFERFERDQDVDFSVEHLIGEVRHRFRANYFVNSQSIGACFRLIPGSIPDFEWAGFPRDIADRLVSFLNGLVLLTGVTGSGKTTTLGMLVNFLNEAGNARIITIEEPIEYRFPKYSGSVVTQREVGLDVRSFADGLKHGLRQDPDVILIGEIRDRETAQMALTAAETGHLVFSTLHTRDAKGAISRYADLFPQDAQAEIRSQLALCLRAVISQHLIPSANAEEKRKLALEIMFNTSPIASAIRTGKIQSIDNYILTGREEGMVPLDESVKRLLYSGQISRESARRFVSDPTIL